MHFNITIAEQGWLPDNFNDNNSNGRRILDDEHIAIWTEGGKTCVSWYADVTTNLTGPGQGQVCRWSSCGTPPPGIAFSPWTNQDAIRYYRTALQGLGKLLLEVGIAVLIVDGIILLIGCIVTLAMVILAAAAGTGLAILAF